MTTRERLNQIRESEWNFSDLPETELVACCYWEYARESAFIRDVVQNVKDVGEGNGSRKPLDAANQDLEELHSIGRPANLFHRLPFPKPWQTLTKKDREKDTNFIPKIPVPIPMPNQFPAFQFGNSLSIAADLYCQARKLHNETMAVQQRLFELSSGVAGLKEAAKLREQLARQKEHPATLIVRGEGGADSFIAQINWRDFTDKQIVDAFKLWVADNRPVKWRRNDRGHKLNDWQVMLDRLAIMRLLHHATLREMRTKFSKAWQQHPSADWYRERKSANRDFHRLFQFLPESELPLSWPTKGGHR